MKIFGDNGLLMCYGQFICWYTATLNFRKHRVKMMYNPEPEVLNGSINSGEQILKTIKMFKESITKEELTDLPLRWFEGKIVVVDKTEQVKGIANYLSSFPVIGFDTETRPSFKKGKTNKVALLQLATPEQAFLFRINKIGLPGEIREILADPNIVKPGVAIRDD